MCRSMYSCVIRTFVCDMVGISRLEKGRSLGSFMVTPGGQG